MLVVGGTAEMRISHPDHIRLVLKERCGFVKIALETGTDLGKRKNLKYNLCKILIVKFALNFEFNKLFMNKSARV
jgi:hypothetical protein